MSPARILVVEDELVNAMDIEDKLKALGYQVVSICTTGEEAVQTALELHPDLILMDIYLKGKMDGIGAAEIIRAQESIAVIYLTASNDEATLERAKITEPYAYIEKPISSRELHIAVEVAIYKHTAEREISTQLQQITAMCMVEAAILNNHDPHHALRVALHQITFQLNLDAAAVLLFNPSDNTLEYFEGYGFRTTSFRNTCLRLGQELAARPSQSFQIEQVKDLSRYPGETSLNRTNEEGFIGYVVLPLFCKDQLKGILEVFRRAPSKQIQSGWIS